MAPAEHALDLLLEAAVLLDADMHRGLGTMGLTTTSAHLLVELGRSGPVPQRHLAEALDVAPRTVTSLVDDLSAAGLVTREPHPHDRRATLVTPTADGVRVLEGLEHGRVDLAASLVGPLGERAERFAADLGEVVARLRDAVAEAGSQEFAQEPAPRGEAR